MIESLRLIGKIEMKKVKELTHRGIEPKDAAECKRLLSKGARPKDVVAATGVHLSSVLRYQSDMKQTAISKDRY